MNCSHFFSFQLKCLHISFSFAWRPGIIYESLLSIISFRWQGDQCDEKSILFIINNYRFVKEIKWAWTKDSCLQCANSWQLPNLLCFWVFYLLKLFTFIAIVFVALLSWDQCSSVTCYSSWGWVEFICWWVVNYKQRACYSPFKSFISEGLLAGPRGSLQLWGKNWSPYLWNHYCWGEETCSIWSSWLAEIPTQGSLHGYRCWPWCETWSPNTGHKRLCSISKL